MLASPPGRYDWASTGASEGSEKRRPHALPTACDKMRHGGEGGGRAMAAADRTRVPARAPDALPPRDLGGRGQAQALKGLRKGAIPPLQHRAQLHAVAGHPRFAKQQEGSP
jgi:hypothetical protein